MLILTLLFISFLLLDEEFCSSSSSACCSAGVSLQTETTCFYRFIKCKNYFKFHISNQ